MIEWFRSLGETKRQANRKRVIDAVVDYAAPRESMSRADEDLLGYLQQVNPSHLGEGGFDFIAVASRMKALPGHYNLKEKILQGYLPQRRTWDPKNVPGGTTEEREDRVARMETALAAGIALRTGRRRDFNKLQRAFQKGRAAAAAYFPVWRDQATGKRPR